MKTAYVSFEVEVPEEATFKQVYEFLEMEIRGEGGVSGDNPMFEYDLQSLNIKSISLR